VAPTGTLEAPTTPAEAVIVIAAAREEAAAAPLSVAARWHGAAGRSALVGVVLVTGPDGSGCWLDGDLLTDAAVREALQVALDGPVAGHDVKELFRSLLGLGVDPCGLVMDLAVAAYLLDPSSGDYSLDALTALAHPENGVASAGAPGPLVVTTGQLALGGDEVVDPSVPATADATVVAQLVGPYRAQLEAEGLLALHDEIETPLVRVLARMEVAGIAVDTEELRRITDGLVAQVARLEGEMHRLAGHEFNVNSTPQLRTVLYDELGLTPGRKTKTGYSTDAATLESLRGVHAIVDTLLEYREVEKLRSTYGENLLAEVGPDGRIHASFRQTVARTGRLSSERPNLHNIPVRTEAGRAFRRAFVPRPGWRLLVADYDQVELRVLAHLSGDPGLIAAFGEGSDVHRAVAASVYGVPLDEVTREQRERAKMVSYGLVYGMEAYGLARRLSTGVDEAREIMTRFFDAFPAVRSYMDATVAEARQRGFTRTETGRKRPLPELLDANHQRRQAAERQAMNSGIQGLAADLFKTALVRLDAGLEHGGFESRLVLQVHDEVLVDLQPAEEAAVEALTRTCLTGAAELRVPLQISLHTGSTWDDAKGG
jgi:DNA polymerase-1